VGRMLEGPRPVPADRWWSVTTTRLFSLLYDRLAGRAGDTALQHAQTRDLVVDIVLDMLADPEATPAVVAELTKAGILRHSDMWAVPVDPGEELTRLAERVDVAETADELDALLHDEGLLLELLEVPGRIGHVYLEGEPRPSCAPALYEIGGDDRASAPITPETVHNDPHGTFIRIFELLCRGPRFEARKLAGALDEVEVDAILDRLSILRQIVREEHGRA
jgi:hypothetical protein